jgi:fatty-acyl-CoA synthase
VREARAEVTVMSWLENLRLDAQETARNLRLMRRVLAIEPEGAYTVADAIEAHVQRAPGAIALRFEQRVLSYAALDAQANRVARWAQRQGLAQGDVVALFMENCPEFIATWLGLAKLGIVTALINTNLAGMALAHSLRISGAKQLVLGVELAERFAAAAPLLDAPLSVWMCGGSAAGAESFDAALEAESKSAFDRAARASLRAKHNLFYIYTSGTTGLPKAANFSHHRFLATATGFAVGSDLTAGDCSYVALPLYHSAGGVAAAGAALVAGTTVALARRFSASRFWSDCVRHDATVFQYIGELCRYLLATPPHPDDTRHRIRVAVGNGLRADVWTPFVERFRIPQIVEFYGATEGNISLVNTRGKIGAVGRVPRALRKLYGTRIVRFDVEREEIVRGPDGRCIECAPGQTGELLGKIQQSGIVRFEGYSDAAATAKKVVRDVFEKGDAYFRTGDLLRSDAAGFYYFVDRIGDTFRWKGENVATGEVAEVLATFPGVREANVYGVKVPNNEGRAGMAALVADAALDLAGLWAHVEKNLAAYARPLFLRFQPELEVTGTLKHRKVALAEEGFDPARVSDPLWFADAARGRYVPLDAALFGRIGSGEARV